MKRIIPLIAALAVAATLSSGHVNADHCRPSVRLVQVQQYQYPAYFGVYGQSGGNEEILRQLLEEFKALREELALARAGIGPGGQLTLEHLAKTDCKSCHQEGKNPRKGFMLFDKDGGWIEPSVDEKKLITVLVQTNDPKFHMPQGRPLSETKKRLYLEALNGSK